MYRGKRSTQFVDLVHPHKLNLANIPTPVTKLDILHHECPVSISVKRDDLTGCALSGNKVRRLEYILYEAKAIQATTILLCGTIDSQYAQTAVIAARSQGKDVHLFVEDDSKEDTEKKLFLHLLVGATIHYLTKEQYQLRQKIMGLFAEEVKKKNQVPFIISDDGDHPSGVWGYISMMRELLDAHGHIPYSHIVVPVGSGTTMAGLLIAKRIFHLDKLQIIGITVQDSSVVTLPRIRNVTAKFNKQYGTNYSVGDHILSDSYVGEGFGIPYPEEVYWIQRLGRLESILLDPVYTGKAFYGMMDLIQKKGYSAFPQRLVHSHRRNFLPSFASKCFEFPKTHTLRNTPTHN